jgi:hypothetical protein
MAPRVQNLLNSEDSPGQIPFYLVLPDADDSPVRSSELREILSVPLSVFFNFRGPKVGKIIFPCGKSITVPKITVHKHGYAKSQEYDIRRSGQ